MKHYSYEGSEDKDKIAYNVQCVPLSLTLSFEVFRCSHICRTLDYVFNFVLSWSAP